ncbi:MAG: hypothetical protein NT150_05045 [Bacteroidetes bacterium]|nr:hypothetical protein [Bacteroidota bacterium]
MKVLISIVTFLVLSSSAFAQDGGFPPPSGDIALAKQYISYFMYGPALDELKLFYKKKPDDEKANELMAECYLNLNDDKTKAIPHLEFLLKQPKYNPSVLFDLGEVYHATGQLDKALEFFNRYKKEGALKETDEVDRRIECVNTAKELMKFPMAVTFTNLGKDINSEYPELTPFVDMNESEIIFTSRKKGTTGNIVSFEGYEPDVFITELKSNDKWSKAKSIGATVNTNLPDEISSLSPEGNYLVYTTSDEIGMQIIKICYKGPKARGFDKPEIPPAPINEPKSNQLAGTVSNDGQVLIFSSDRPGGYGGYDLYVSQKLPNGIWGEPINLGSKINTKYDENFPNFGVDQNVLFFASTGHTNMGGFDIFKTIFSQESHSWKTPTNLGYPINTTDNDYTISFNKTGRNAYLSRNKIGGWGNTDIYQMTINSVEPERSAYAVYLKPYVKYETEIRKADSLILVYKKSLEGGNLNPLLSDSLTKKIETLKTKKEALNPVTGNVITVKDLTRNKEYGEYQPNLKTGRFIMILEPGSYEITVESDKYKVSKTKITVYDKSNFVSEKTMDIILHKGELDAAAPVTKP